MVETITPGPGLDLAGEVKLDGVRLAAGGATTLDIATIDQSFDTLVARGRLRGNGAGATFVGAILSFNNDTDDTHYRQQYHQANAANSTSVENVGAASVRAVGLIPDGASLAGAFMEFVIRIQDYASVDNIKTARISSSFVYKLTTGGYIVRETVLARTSGLDAIDRISLFTAGGFAAGSALSLYGVKSPF